MFTKRRFLTGTTIWCVTFAALAGGLIWPARARVNAPALKPAVCACCAEEGTWYERRERVTGFYSDQLDRIKFSPTANTYMSPGEDEYQFSNSYALTQTRQGRRWQLSFRDDKGKTGAISFMMPASLTVFGVDLRDQPSGGLGPALYKELRLTGTAQVTGVLRQGIKGPARFHLVLQGRGNNCTEAENFKNWTLQIIAPRTSHAFYGSLSDPQ